MVISLLETVIITNVLHHNSMKYREVPHWVRVLVLQHIANLICYRWPEGIRPSPWPSSDKPDKSESDAGVCVVQTITTTPAPAQQQAGREAERAGWLLPCCGRRALATGHVCSVVVVFPFSSI